MLRYSVFVMLSSSIFCFTLISAGPLAQDTAASSSFSSLTKRSTSEDGIINADPIICSENEEYSECSNGGCFQTDCYQLGRPPFCRDLPEYACIPGCICKYDHLRNASGTCVPSKDCPKNEYCSEPNEYYDPCPPSCPLRDCSYLGSEATCPPQPKEGDNCYPSCRCKEGFYSYYGQDCVPYEDCSKVCSGKNEHFVPYPKMCEPQTCDSVKNPNVIQNVNTSCSGCRCFPDFVRNKHGDCIAKENCDKCQGPNEYFGCKSSCDNECATLNNTNKTECTTENDWTFCVDKCYCDDGYARDVNNICIPIADCPEEK